MFFAGFVIIYLNYRGTRHDEMCDPTRFVLKQNCLIKVSSESLKHLLHNSYIGPRNYSSIMGKIIMLRVETLIIIFLGILRDWGFLNKQN